jgi:hypothetical protein
VGRHAVAPRECHDQAVDPEALFDGVAGFPAVLERVRMILAPLVCEVRVTHSQVAFRAQRGFAWLWRPSRYLGRRGVDVVLAIALDHRDPSARWKEVAHPTPRHWIHHLEISDAQAIDDQVAGWLLEAARLAGARRRDAQSPV